MYPVYFLSMKSSVGGAHAVDKSVNLQKEDDYCMTATTDKVVYVVGRQKPDAGKQPVLDAKKIAEAVARTAKYVKK